MTSAAHTHLLKMRRRLFRRKLVLVSIIVILVLVALAILGPAIAPHDPSRIDVMNRLTPPGWEYLLGTDGFGRDILSRMLFGARLSLFVSLLVVLLATSLGTLAGIVAGYFEKLDGPIMRIMDATMAFPEILLAIALMAALGPSLFNVVIALSVVYTPRMARVVRASALVVARMQFTEAARSIGASSPRILLRHILPSLLTPIIIQATFIFAYTILAESSLSFLGVGVPPEMPTWGNMINEGKPFFVQADWLMLIPGAAIVVTVVAFQTVGDGLRDMLDPRLRDID
ncbi:MAG: ABC transporter permease [Trueperaceae bacterium]